jgi:hypothetical protein
VISLHNAWQGFAQVASNAFGARMIEQRYLETPCVELRHDVELEASRRVTYVSRSAVAEEANGVQRRLAWLIHDEAPDSSLWALS